MSKAVPACAQASGTTGKYSADAKNRPGRRYGKSKLKYFC